MGRIGAKCSAGKIAKIYVALQLCLGNLAYGSEKLVDRLVAEVNGDPITYSEVQEKVKKKVLVEVSPYPATEQDSAFEIALQDSINLKLVMQKAEELEIDVDDQQLEEEISKFIKRRGLSKESLLEALEQEGMSYEDYRKDWRKQMIISQFQGREIMPSVKITDKDIEIYYLQETGDKGESLKLTLRQLYIKVPKSPDSVKKGKEAIVERAYSELQDGLNFDKAVKIYSNNESNRDKGGLMPPVMLKDLSPVIRKEIEKLSVNEFTKPIQIGGGYYIFYLEKKEFSGNDDFRRQKPQLEQKLRQTQIVDQTTKWIDTERRRSEIRVIDK